MKRFSSLTVRLAGQGSQRWAIHQAAIARQRAGEAIVMLSIGEPDTPTPPSIIDQAERSMRAGRTMYAATRGEPEFLEAVARRYSRRLGRHIDPEQAIFMPGSHTALYAVCLSVLEAGDELVVPEPYYAAYDPIFASTGADLVYAGLSPEDQFHLRVDVLEAAITPRTRAVLVNNPHNPTGAVLTPDRVAEIAALCNERGVWLISDEVYEDLVYDGSFASPLVLPEFADTTVVVSSVSKSHSMTGWRCGWAVGPVDLIDRVQDMSEAMMFGSQPFLQDATVHALDEEFIETKTMYDDYMRRAAEVVERLGASPSLGVRMPQGGIFVMVDVRPTGLSGVEFATRLLDDHAVATMPGESFGPSAAGHIRLSLTCDDVAISDGIGRILEFVGSL